MLYLFISDWNFILKKKHFFSASNETSFILPEDMLFGKAQVENWGAGGGGQKDIRRHLNLEIPPLLEKLNLSKTF